jgi:hypothetical protein
MEERLIVNILKNLVPMEYWDLFDWTTVISRCKEVEKGIYCYDCHFLKLYFDERMRPVTYGKQKVVGEKVYYDLNETDYGAGTLTYLGDISYYD